MADLEHREVDFYGTHLIAVRDKVGLIWVPLRALCEAIGLDYASQYTKVKADYVLGKHTSLIAVAGNFGRSQEVVCLDLNFVRGWLFSVNVNRVKPEVRDQLVRFQEQVYEVINRAFERMVPPDDGLSDAMIRSIVENLDQQKKLWETVLQEKQRLRAVEGWIQDIDDRTSDIDRELSRQQTTINTVLSDLQQLRQNQLVLTTELQGTLRLLPKPSDSIDAAQKAAIKALVDDIVSAAQAKGVRLGQGRNDYPAVWDAFKRRFDLAKYDELTIAKFDDAILWLKTWLERLEFTYHLFK